MASKAIRAKAMSMGIVKAVPSGNTLVIMEMGNTASTEIPPERTIILSSLMAPKLARRGEKQSTDEPFAWQSREFLRNLCIGKEVVFQVDYTLTRGLKFGTVFLGDKNVAFWVVAQGWAKLKTVRDLEKDKGEFSPFLKELKKWEDKAKENGAGCWSKATAGAVRDLPPSLIGDPNRIHEMTDLVEENMGREIKAIVEYVRDGSTLHVYLLPDYHHVRVFVAGVQAPSMRNLNVEPVKTEANGKLSNGSHSPLTSAQKVVAPSTSVTQGAPEDIGRESKHFTEIRVLHRDVCIVLEGVDERGKLIGRVCYLDGHRKDLAQQLVENGLAKYVDCGNFLPADVKRHLKSSELVAKKSRLRMWNNYMSPPTDKRAITDQNFTGKVVEVVSGDCIVVAADSSAKRRVYLSSIRCPGLFNGRGEDRGKAREFLKKHLFGHQVHVSMEYSKNERPGYQNRPAAEERVMEFGSVHLESQSGSAEDAPLAPPTAGSQQQRTNIAEVMVARGFAEVIRHRDFELRSDHYDALLDAEYHAKSVKVGMHSVEKYFDGQDISNGQAIRRKPKEKLQIQDNYVKGQEVSGSQAIERKPKEELQVVVKEVLGGGRFYVQTTADQKAASIIQQKLASLRLREPPAIGSYNPKKGDLVIAQYSQDNYWYRATIVDAPKGAVRSAKAKFEVFYIDYGTQESVPYSRLRPSDCYSLPSSPGLAKLCSLAHVKVPGWKEDYGKEAACRLSDYILRGHEFKAIVEERDNSGGEFRYNTGTNHIVTLMDTEARISINAIMLKDGLARLDKRGQEDESVNQTIDELKAYQNEARKMRLGMWKNGDINSDDEKNLQLGKQ